MDSVECIVVGAGVVGLAIARSLARSGREVIVLEAADAFGTETSSRNSEVIHAGIYYPKDSLKATLCVKGKQMLYAYCAAHHVACNRLGKLIVASSDEQLAALDQVVARAVDNGVDDLRLIDRKSLAALEPDLRGTAALLSPSTGIVDSHGLMLALVGELEDHGGAIAYCTRLDSVAVKDGFVVGIAGAGGDEIYTMKCGMLVNAAGLGAMSVAARIDGMPRAVIPRLSLAKGNYFALSGTRAPFRHLIYPVPEAHGLGVHLTLDLAGQARFGPDVEWIDEIDYGVEPRRGDAFCAAIRKYWPDLPDGALVPAYSGIRPKIVGPNAPAADFVIQSEAQHGIRGLINLFGIESPGLTSSLAIAEHVQGLLSDG